MDKSARNRRVSPRKVFTTFLILGATSIGGGMMAHIREAVVVREGWLTDEEFLECYGLCQTLPGLNTTNLAVLIGERVAGAWGTSSWGPSPRPRMPTRLRAEARPPRFSNQRLPGKSFTKARS